MKLPSFERARTMLLLHRFFRTSLLVGRMPSLIGREIFRPNVRSVPARALEDAVVFVCDVERVLRNLEAYDQRLIAFCVLEDRSEWEAARVFHRSQVEVSRRLGEVLDLLHETFCRLGLLPRLAQILPYKTKNVVPRRQRSGGNRDPKTKKNDADVKPPSDVASETKGESH
jgi:hypothetical protein